MRIALAGVAALLLAAGCSKLTAENYAKVKMGMSYNEVTAILGGPASCDDTAGFKSCRWGDDKRQVTVRFAGDKVILHTAENIR
jgi:outer membrane protein assembly factor BamE (lipoprotein component of BamABCDE complex)